MKKLGVILACLVFVSVTYGQKIKLKSGSLSFLNDVKAFKLVFDYSDMGVGKFDKEEDYVAKKVKEYNKKEAGKGDKWAKSWVDDRSKRYEPKFEELINKYLKPKKNIKSGRDLDDANYIMTIKTTFTEPGFNIGITRAPAYINATITFAKASDPSKVLATLEIIKSPGADAMGYDFDAGLRISEAYAKMAKSLSKFLLKKGFK